MHVETNLYSEFLFAGKTHVEGKQIPTLNSKQAANDIDCCVFDLTWD